eukprot:1156139-Pelagomonas_calceolata.AAC.9
MRIRRVASSSPFLILVMRVERSLLTSASGARKPIGVLDRMSITLGFGLQPGGQTALPAGLCQPNKKQT